MKSKAKPEKKRLDLLLIERGLAESRQRARGLILAGKVLVDRQKLDKAGTRVATDAAVEIIGEALPYVSRGGLKLAGALDDFGLSPRSKVCLDVGSSTGGFADCLLQHGAEKVYAVDVNVNQMAWKLQQDPRVFRVERNARYLTPRDVSERASFVTVDVSFISVGKILSALVPLATPGADFLILVKPQFELGKKDVGKGGIVRDPRMHEKAIERVKTAVRDAGLATEGVCPSRLPGAEGNLEFFLHARRSTLR